MRVVHVVTRWETGGAQETALALANGLASRGADVHLLGGIVGATDEAGYRHGTLRHARTEVVPFLGREISPVRDLLAGVALFLRIRALRPAVVHTHSSKAGLLGRVAARVAGVDLIVHTVHGWGFANEPNAWRRTIFRRLERAVARFTDILVVVAESDIKVGLEAGVGSDHQYRVVRAAIDLGRFYPPDAPTHGATPTIGSVTRLDKAKDPLTLVEACGLLRDWGVDFRVQVVGDGPLCEAVENRIAELDLSGHVELLGTRRDVDSILRQLDVFVLTDRRGALPRALVEAAATGLPIVSTDFSGVREVVDDGVTGLLCRVGDANAIALALQRLLADAGYRSRLGKAGTTVAQSFDAEAMVDQTAEIYCLPKKEPPGRRRDIAPLAGGGCPFCDGREAATDVIAASDRSGVSHDEFVYQVCARCSSLILANPPEDLGPFYPEDYCSSSAERSALEKPLWKAVSLLPFPSQRRAMRPLSAALAATLRTAQSPCAGVVDIGGDSGRLADRLSDLGFGNVLVVDPFASDPQTPGGNPVRQVSLSEIRQPLGADVLMYHHSLEHVRNPRKEIDAARRHLHPNGALLIRVPVCSSDTFDLYREGWVGVDAPRHLTVPSRQGLLMMLRRAQFEVVGAWDDSTAFQFWGSSGGNSSRTHLPAQFWQRPPLGSVRARWLNAKRRGDAVAVVARPKSRS